MLKMSKYLVKERVGFLKFTDTFDIFSPETGVQVGIAREKISVLMKLLRLLVNKTLLPTTVVVTETGSETPLFTIKKGLMFLSAKVSILASDDREVGYFKSKIFSIGGSFRVFDTSDKQVAEVKGDWKGWNFRFLDTAGNQLGTVTRKWGGIGKELFTSADNYMIALENETKDEALATLLLAAGLAIDIVYKERK
jgi:uncharacterized protein YxjI